ncbi:ankyrin repeat and LEM domain-containing protein 1 [Pipra filicauda]|uniref:Ankyrin repeat and LEM domain-containing protein 1 n=1 Tax=Pipra filicauda TaxID=649802 RepID=A0A7R5L5P0_9PASS|nr:ankyrin repeat and LEM domain-containing protein 1 [Pipra filicauda]
MSGTRSRELTPLHEAAARGCRRCLGLLLRERGHLRDQDGKQAVDVVLEQGWPLVEAPGGCRRALSFLTEDDSDGSVSPGFPEDNSEAGPLSSTRRSLLEEQELGGHCVPSLWQGRAPEPPALPPWLQGDPRGSAVPPQPLASSTLLWDRDELQEGPPSWPGGGRTGPPPWAPPQPSVGDIRVPCPQFGPGGSLRDPQCCSRTLGGHRAPLPCRGLSSCSELSPSPGDSDIPQHRPGVPWGGVGGAGDVGELLARLQGCSLRGSPPCTPRSPHSPAGVTAGDVTPRDQEPPGHRHITPRTRSRLRAVAERLNSSSSSSSSSLFNGTLPMPRRPPRIRSPRGVPRDPATPPGHCVTPRDEDVSGEGGEGTDSLEDTQILPGALSSPPGGFGSSPGSSPTVLLCPGDPATPPHPPSGPRGSPHPGVLEGGSGWHCHSPSGTPQFQWPHGSSRRLLAPQASSSAGGDLGTPSVPLSPPGCGPHCSGGRREDEGQGLSPPECHSPGTGATPSPEDAPGRDGRVSPVSPGPLSDQSLRRRLRELGEDAGPVTDLTRGLYRRRLRELGTGHGREPGGHSPELVAALRTGHIPDCAQDELALARQFERPDRGRRWREGLLKSSFNYLLLDPRTTRDLPQRCPHLSPAQRFQTFVSAVFYVGKGTRARPYCHLAEALGQHRAGTRRGCPKVRRILEIWESGHGVVSVLCFQNRVPAEAYTREGCMVEALGLQTLTNQRKGHCYGVAAGWAPERRRRLGVHMLYRAMSIFLAEGERQLRPGDIPGR